MGHPTRPGERLRRYITPSSPTLGALGRIALAGRAVSASRASGFSSFSPRLLTGDTHNDGGGDALAGGDLEQARSIPTMFSCFA